MRTDGDGMSITPPECLNSPEGFSRPAPRSQPDITSTERRSGADFVNPSNSDLLLMNSILSTALAAWEPLFLGLEN